MRLIRGCFSFSQCFRAGFFSSLSLPLTPLLLTRPIFSPLFEFQQVLLPALHWLVFSVTDKKPKVITKFDLCGTHCDTYNERCEPYMLNVLLTGWFKTLFKFCVFYPYILLNIVGFP